MTGVQTCALPICLTTVLNLIILRRCRLTLWQYTRLTTVLNLIILRQESKYVSLNSLSYNCAKFNYPKTFTLASVPFSMSYNCAKFNYPKTTYIETSPSERSYNCAKFNYDKKMKCLIEE